MPERARKVPPKEAPVIEEPPVAQEPEEVQLPPEEGVPEEPPRDHPRGYVGWVYEDVFENLYRPATLAEGPTADDQPEEGKVEASELEEPEVPVRQPDGEVDLSAEEAEIAALQAQLEQERDRLGGVLGSLQERQTQALQQDREDAEELQGRWGLTMREQYPVGDSKLRTLLDPERLKREGLIHPHGTLQDLERQIEIRKGQTAQHDNLLAVSKPEEPNHYKTTAALKLRMQSRNVRPTLTEGQRAAIAEDLDEKRQRRPQVPKGLSAEERQKNHEIVKRMQTTINFLKNPRLQADRGGKARGEANPFAISPSSLVFRNYEIGGVYELDCEFRNTAQVGRRIRVLPCSNKCFSVGALRYDSDKSGKRPPGTGSVVAPGMSARLTVRFAPATLNNENDELTVCTEVGDFGVPLLAQREQPRLKLQQPVDCGCALAGTTTERHVRLANRGGEGSFRLIPAETDADMESFRYEEGEGETHIISPAFSVFPARFYLEANQSIDLSVCFAAPEVGQHRCALLVECDNGTCEPLTLVGITDAVRLELSEWPTRHRPVQPPPLESGTSPWAHVPWRLNWQGPGAQVGGRQLQTISISNGGYLPIKAQWRLACPPRELLSRLAVGDQPRLTDDLIAGVRSWPTHEPGAYGSVACPFTVEPTSVELAPFSSATFTFAFHAHVPVGRRATAVACLEATDIPANGECLLHCGRLLQLQEQMRPEDYQPGLPLFGGAVSGRFALDPAGSNGGTASCTVTAICLQGTSSAPVVTCEPCALVLPGATAPFLAHRRQLKLHNAGELPASFRVRLSSDSGSTQRALWVLGAHELGHEPGEAEEPEGATEFGRAAARLLAQRVPLPPPHSALGLPGCGAAATVAVEPHEGQISPGEDVTLNITIRAPRESGIGGQLTIDLPVSSSDSTPAVPPLQVAVLGAVRSPSVSLRHTSCLDYGVVRAHAQHVETLLIENTSDLPLLVRLRHLREGDENPAPGSADPSHSCRVGSRVPANTISEYQMPFTPLMPPIEPASSSTSRGDQRRMFPLSSHQEVVDLFAESVRRGSKAGFSVVGAYEEDSPVKPWVHARSGCLDKSGRRRPLDGVSETDAEDFAFKPSCLVVWPRARAEVQVTLRTREPGEYSALLEAIAFDSQLTQCIEVFAQVQLPKLRLSTQHCHFPVTYSQTPSEPVAVVLRNDSDLPADFRWAVSSRPDACLEVRVNPSDGRVPPKGQLTVDVTARPTQLTEDNKLARLVCPLFTNEVLQPVLLVVTAQVFGPEVDYAVLPVDEIIPHSKLQSQGPDGENSSPAYPVTVGRARGGLPIVDFGEMELQKSKFVQVVLYNRTRIATPFSARMKEYMVPGALSRERAEDAAKACPLTAEESLLQRFSFASVPRAVPAMDLDDDDDVQSESTLVKTGGTAKNSKGGSSQSRVRSGKSDAKSRHSSAQTKSSSKKRRFLLDDAHEKQNFRSTNGEVLAKQKEEKEQGVVALKQGRGWAVQVSPREGLIQPLNAFVVTLTCFSDLPGLMEDELVLNIPELAGHTDGQDFRIPVRLLSFGNPLYLPEQQVGLNLTVDPPRLSCGTITPAEKFTTRRFRVGNSSSAKLRVKWEILAKRQLEGTAYERQLLSVGRSKSQGYGDFLAELGSGNGTHGYKVDEQEANAVKSPDLREVEDPFALAPSGEPPLRIEPPEAVILQHGKTWFSVTMLASKATTSAANHYHYILVGKGSFTEEHWADLASVDAEGEERRSRAPMHGPVLHGIAAEVKSLPEIKLDASELEDSDSDAEPVKSHTTAEEVSVASVRLLASPSANKLWSEKEPDPEVVSTLVVDCVGDCVLPWLTVDKKAHPAVEDFPRQGVAEEGLEGADGQNVLHCPVFKFTHSVLTPPVLRSTGATHGALPGSAQIPGIVSCMIRQITLSNFAACDVSCRFRVEGPFRIREVAQVGHVSVKPVLDSAKTRKKKTQLPGAEDALRQIFRIPKQESVTLHVEFMVDMVPSLEWTQHRAEHKFQGDLIVEYPRDVSPHSDGEMDLQRVHLVATSRRPAVCVTIVPTPELDRPLKADRADRPSWAEVQPVVADFGYVHVEGAVVRRRTLLLSNITNVPARWSLLHVGRKRRAPRDIGVTLQEEEDFGALDEKDAFQFDVTEGELLGPSKDGIVAGSKERQPHWSPPLPGVVKAPPQFEEEKYEPQAILVTFHPTKNELYKCKFRIQVESGLSIDFICRGCGSYDEEDDAMDFQES